MIRLSFQSLSSLVVAGAAAGLPALAIGPGAIPICPPATITTSGVYAVTCNASSAGGPLIDIPAGGATDVVLDLGGFTLTGSPGIDVIRVDGLRSFTVRDGTLLFMGGAAGNGVDVANTERALVSDMQVLYAYTGIELQDVKRFTVQESEIQSPQNFGIHVDGSGSPVPVRGYIQGNLVYNSGSTGILVSNNHFGVAVTSNTVDGAEQGAGIQLYDGVACTVDGNSVTQAILTGIRLQQMQGCRVTENFVQQNQDGIVLFDTDNTLVGANSAANNSASGAVIDGDGNRILSNGLFQNGGAGLWLQATSTNSLVKSNLARFNVSAPGACGPDPGGPSPDLCDSSGGSVTYAGGNHMPTGPF